MPGGIESIYKPIISEGKKFIGFIFCNEINVENRLNKIMNLNSIIEGVFNSDVEY